MFDTKQKRDLNYLLSDSSSDIRKAASLAIGALTQPSNIESVIDILMNGDEQTRQCAAELWHISWPGS